jgi:hypothetical protein
MIPGQYVYVSNAGLFQISTVPTVSSVILKNTGAVGNVPDGTLVGTGQNISPSGSPGVAGAPGATPTLDDISPTTSKGDTFADNGANNPNASVQRFAVGADGTRLMADSGQATGLLWQKVDLADTTEVTGTLPVSQGGTGATTRTVALDNVAPTGVVSGDILYYNGTHWVRLARGNAGDVLTTLSTNIPGWTQRGRVLQEILASTVSTQKITTQIPYDDTIPQSSEGTELFSQAFTPKDTTSSYIEIEAEVSVTADATDQMIIALFKNAETDALSATAVFCDTTNKQRQLRCFYRFTAAGALFTVKCRLGTATPSNLFVNSIDNAGAALRKFGGVQLSWLRITEYST